MWPVSSCSFIILLPLLRSLPLTSHLSLLHSPITVSRQTFHADLTDNLYNSLTLIVLSYNRAEHKLSHLFNVIFTELFLFFIPQVKLFQGILSFVNHFAIRSSLFIFSCTASLHCFQRLLCTVISPSSCCFPSLVWYPSWPFTNKQPLSLLSSLCLDSC